MAISISSVKNKMHATSERREEAGTNVSNAERLISTVGGGLLLAYGVSHLSARRLPWVAAGGALLYRGVTGHCPAYGALGVSTAHNGGLGAIQITQKVIIDRPRAELYAFWRELQNLPHFMHHLKSVQVLDTRRSEWVMHGPKSVGTVTWEAEITEDKPNELIAWQSLPGSTVENAGRVLFREASAGRGTEVEVSLEYRPVSGVAAKGAAALLRPVLSETIKEDIRRFKSLMEAGEIPTTKGQPAGRKRSMVASLGQRLPGRSAQPGRVS